MANKTIGGNVDHWIREVTTLAPSVGNFTFILIQSLARWPHLPKVDHLVEGTKIISNGVRPSKKTVGERKTAESSPPGDRKIERRKRCVTHPSLNIRASSTSTFEGQVANSRPQQEPESIYPGTTGAIPGARDARPHEPRTPMPRAPREESSDSTHFQQKDNVIKNPSCQIQCAQD
ncbi:hypothetical protein CK203_111132 [Vitis vinifera]|uniref:Uncharacterized protein n=1 Tax=Vitis vinifera TaxID=29760 RepID=A0A438FDQ8_VITVI|nr:hypothetical protein CK203_111132 [Vitis vinifera]